MARTRPRYSLRKKGQGWEIRITHEGQRTSHWFKGTEEDAHAKAAEIIEEKRQGTHVKPVRLTVGQLLDDWQKARAADGVELMTWRIADYCIRCHLKPAVGDLQATKLTGLMLDGLYQQVAEKGLSDATRKQVHAVINQCLTWAVKKRLLARNVAQDATVPKVEVKEPTVLNEERTAQLIAAAEGSSLYLPILLGAHTGMRVSEIAALEWDAIDLQRGLLEVRQSNQLVRKRVREAAPAVGKMKAKLAEVDSYSRAKCPKNKKQRMVGMSPQLVAALRAEWERREAAGIDEPRVCLTADGRPRTGDSISLMFGRFVADLSGFPRITFHGLRHGAATHLAAAGVHPSAAAAMLGHSSWKMTQHYTHCDADGLRAAAAVLGASIHPLKSSPEGHPGDGIRRHP